MKPPVPTAGGRGRLLLLALLLPCSCLEVQGGAVEAGWDMRLSQDGQRVGCRNDGSLQGVIGRLQVRKLYMALSLVPTAGGDDPCRADARCRFACETVSDEILTGHTPFFIPTGEYAIATRALGVDPDGVAEVLTTEDLVLPPPVVREVVDGQVTDLDINLVIVQR